MHQWTKRKARLHSYKPGTGICSTYKKYWRNVMRQSWWTTLPPSCSISLEWWKREKQAGNKLFFSVRIDHFFHLFLICCWHTIQPAIYVASLAAVEVLRAQEKGQDIIDSVDVTCGLSLGEYTALAFAGAFRCVLPSILPWSNSDCIA
jgi:hypothetical protein